MLATSWKPNGNGTVWTFKLRQGVKFHNGAAMTADDVVWTIQQLADPKNASNALSTLEGVLKPAGVRKVDDATVEFHLEAPNGNFPYLISSDNYNAIIVPKGTDYAKWDTTFIGTGPFKLKSFTQNVSAAFDANPDYWGGAPNLAGTTFSFYASQQPQVLALQGGQVDVIVQFVTQGAQSLLNNPQYQILKFRSSNHRELSMRNDQSPFTDARVRQAIALTLDRPGTVKALLNGYGDLGNDNPFAPKFPSDDTSIPQRAQDLAKAKQLLSAAGHSGGFSTTLTTEQYEEVPALAQVIAAAAAKIGIKIKLKVETQANYYGKATYGNSDWLDAPMSLVDYGDRGVPNVFLEANAAPRAGRGTRRASATSPTTTWSSSTWPSVDLQTQKSIAGKIETLLLDQTPLIIPYFNNGLLATAKGVQNVLPSATGAGVPRQGLQVGRLGLDRSPTRMIAFIAKRVGLGVITLFILSLIVFFAAQVLPGDPARAILGPLAAPSAVKALSHQLGTDKPVLAQYGTWIGHFVTGSFGTSYQYQAPVGPAAGQGAGQLAQAGGAGVRDRRAAGDPRRRRRGTQRRQADRPRHQRRSACRRPSSPRSCPGSS